MAQAGANRTGLKKAVVSPVFNEICEQTGVTLTRYMMEFSRQNPEHRDLESLMCAIQTACKTIASIVERAPITGLVGCAAGGSTNLSGDEQKKLDVVTNDVLKQSLAFTGKVGVIASEEEDAPVFNADAYKGPMVPGTNKTQEVLAGIGSKYVTVFDPLDGSSNVDAHIPTGTIFGVYQEAESMASYIKEGQSGPAARASLLNTLQPGTALVASGYCLYSCSCMFVMTLGAGTHGFTYDRSIGEFVLTHPHMQIPKRGKIYSLNEANRWGWDQPLQDYVTAIQTAKGQTKTAYSLRYIGSMVGDVHRTLLYGGIFGYPADTKNKDGKLRLLYEAAPMSFLVEQAGGLALTGNKRVMDVRPASVHQRVPFFVGSAEDVLEMKSFYDACSNPHEIHTPLNRAHGDWYNPDDD
jgi:fructose-1,6-bisphosphatase I|eukprot:Tamp_07737.p1 GENE.Tamp_07737~~Tamp_07737.p1  ORF type:complete len:410 (+),score=105.54 Tamp_07737:126-1355(+)